MFVNNWFKLWQKFEWTELRSGQKFNVSGENGDSEKIRTTQILLFQGSEEWGVFGLLHQILKMKQCTYPKNKHLYFFNWTWRWSWDKQGTNSTSFNQRRCFFLVFFNMLGVALSCVFSLSPCSPYTELCCCSGSHDLANLKAEQNS